MRVMLWGTYDLGKPRVRIMRACLRRIDPELQEIHAPVWEGVEDKSGLGGFGRMAGIGQRWIAAYPRLIWRFLRAEKPDVVVVGYLGLLDVLVLAIFTKIRGIPIVWDAFLSLYNTYVEDRRLASTGSLRARLLRLLERTAGRLADRVVIDTAEHGKLLADLHGIPASKIGVVLVGAEENAFTMISVSPGHAGGPLRVLFYGQFIPLHGIDTIVEAAVSPRSSQYRWTIIGRGQEAERIDHLLESANCDHIERISWVDYGQLRDQIARADICLGIFGKGKKAASVIPNKVFQALAAGKPLITADTPAMRELLADGALPGLYLVPPNDPDGLIDALERFSVERTQLPAQLHEELVSRFSLVALTDQWRVVLEKVCKT
mgnify:CR=1 FL=1